MKKIIIIIVALIVISSVWLGTSSSKKTKIVTENKITTTETAPLYNQELVMTDFAYTPKDFTAGPSQTIKVQLNNKGKLAHSFTFDKLDYTSGLIEAGQVKIVTFTVPSKPDSYGFYSAGPDAKDKEMVGTLIVK